MYGWLVQANAPHSECDELDVNIVTCTRSPAVCPTRTSSQPNKVKSLYSRIRVDNERIFIECANMWAIRAEVKEHTGAKGTDSGVVPAQLECY